MLCVSWYLVVAVSSCEQKVKVVCPVEGGAVHQYHSNIIIISSEGVLVHGPG